LSFFTDRLFAVLPIDTPIAATPIAGKRLGDELGENHAATEPINPVTSV